MHPVHDEKRREARAKALGRTLKEEEGVAYVDAAEYKGRGAMTAAVVNGDRHHVASCSVNTDDPETAEEVAVALALSMPGVRIIVCDLQTAVRHFAKGRVSPKTLRVLRGATCFGERERVRLVWTPAHAPLPGNQEPHDAARGLTVRAGTTSGAPVASSGRNRLKFSTTTQTEGRGFPFAHNSLNKRQSTLGPSGSRRLSPTGRRRRGVQENTTRMREANLGPASDGVEAASCVVGRGEEIRVSWMALRILLGTTSGRPTSSRTERTAARCLLKTRFACTVVQVVSKQRAHSRPFENLPKLAKRLAARLTRSVVYQKREDKEQDVASFQPQPTLARALPAMPGDCQLQSGNVRGLCHLSHNRRLHLQRSHEEDPGSPLNVVATVLAKGVCFDAVYEYAALPLYLTGSLEGRLEMARMDLVIAAPANQGEQPTVKLFETKEFTGVNVSKLSAGLAFQKCIATVAIQAVKITIADVMTNKVAPFLNRTLKEVPYPDFASE
ncbi:hypothetical protein HPB47_027707 [Ixodes persulcatus]|uniref:Uncharacterized protein n=1 Tax=Ixodes persulcatus TaxID=34615 RepID=A0AC60PVQ7_IXOPE|nr:hypothetical protein HPB47_027707 [Ixodes persulcatus]